jgi:ribosomal protein S18 acetylase RimI-like enzyme
VDVDVRAASDAERAAAGGVAGRALADNPTFRWAAGEETLTRVHLALEVFVGYVQGQSPPPLAAFLGPHLVGVCGVSEPGTCLGHIAPEEWRTQPSDVGEPGDPARAISVWALFYEHDLAERHWHVGPVAVEPGLQGCGVGAAMLRALNARLDADGEVAWLETDKPENVVFYRRAGYEVAEEVDHHGVTTWFMRRDPR